MNQLITQDSAPDVLAEINDAFRDIPFGNSDYQIDKFVLAAQITPERMYRQIGLEIHSKLQAVLVGKCESAKRAIKRRALMRVAADPKSTADDIELAMLDVELMDMLEPSNMKSMDDAIHELNLLYARFKALPKYTREQFELAEEGHYTERLERQVAGLVGAKEALLNMKEDAPYLLSHNMKDN